MCVDPMLGSVYTYQRHKVWQYVPYRETRGGQEGGREGVRLGGREERGEERV